MIKISIIVQNALRSIPLLHNFVCRSKLQIRKQYSQDENFLGVEIISFK